jgi:hypothetical protein
MDGGTCQAAVAGDLAGLASAGPVGASLAATALILAGTLDDGAGLATAAVARELRATLLALAGSGGGDDDGTQGLLAELSAPVHVSRGGGRVRVCHRRRASHRAVGVWACVARSCESRGRTARHGVPRVAALLCLASDPPLGSRSRRFRPGWATPRRPRRSTPTAIFGQTAMTAPAQRSTPFFLRTLCGLRRWLNEISPCQGRGGDESADKPDSVHHRKR